MKRLSFRMMVISSIVLFAIACSPNPYGKTNRSYRKQVKAYSKLIRLQPEDQENDTIKNTGFWVGTTNFGMRKPNFVIIHHTAQKSCEQTLQTFTNTKTAVSAHYVISKDGTVYHMLNDYLRGQHAGVSKWGNVIDMNSSSIGIELDNNGFESFDSLQINSLLSVLAKLKMKYTIPTANFIGHGDIAPTRKNDPNYRFPWQLLAVNGFGIWYDDVREDIPLTFNPIHALRIIGYDVRDTTAAIRSFKRHFLQDTTRGMNDMGRSVLYNLQQKYR